MIGGTEGIMEKSKTNLKDMSLKELEGYMKSTGEKTFRAKQVFQWMYRGVSGFDEMTDLSKPMRDKLEQEATISCLSLDTVQKSEDGTRKYLFRTRDGNHIESVFMKYKYGNSICVSSQAGCAMGCKFCASGVDGLARDLTAGEIADQVIQAENETGEKISHIVVMGTGEPFNNYDALIKFIDMMHAEEGLGIGLRNITVSTCGIIPVMEKFTEEYPQVNLAISLHAPNDRIRKEIMPVAESFGMDELLTACREHVKKTGRRVTFEYALIRGLNDSDRNISELAGRLRGMICHVNLIPLNSVKESGLRGSTRKRAMDIAEYLDGRGIPCTVRRELGSDIDAACGQLRLSRETEINDENH
mgnify:CR=1 FL=1